MPVPHTLHGRFLGCRSPRALIAEAAVILALAPGCGGQSDSTTRQPGDGRAGAEASRGGASAGGANGGEARPDEPRGGASAGAGNGAAGDDAIGAGDLGSCAQDEARRIIQGNFDDIRSTALSDDGSVIVAGGLQAATGEGAIWRWSDGADAAEPVLTAPSANVLAVSADGSIVLAEQEFGDVLWRAGTVLRLPFDRHPWDCVPRLSRDGASVVGCAGRRAVLVRSGVEAVLELPPGFEASMPLAIDTNGSAIAGLAYSLDAAGDAIDSTSVIWTSTGGALRAKVLRGYRAVAVSDGGGRAIVLAKVVDAPVRTSAFRWSDDGAEVFLGGWDHAVGSTDLSVAVGAEDGTLRRWTESSGVDIHGFDQWNVTRALKLASSGDRALVEGSAAVCVSGRCPAGRALWDRELGWRRFDGSLSGDGRVVARAARCGGRAVVERIDLSALDQHERSRFWGDRNIPGEEPLPPR